MDATAVDRAVVDIPYTYHVTVFDPDAGDSLTITAHTRPAWLTLTDHGDGTATLAGTQTEAGDDDVVLQVSDGQASDTQAFTVKVRHGLYLPLVIRR